MLFMKLRIKYLKRINKYDINLKYFYHKSHKNKIIMNTKLRVKYLKLINKYNIKYFHHKPHKN